MMFSHPRREASRCQSSSPAPSRAAGLQRTAGLSGWRRHPPGPFQPRTLISGLHSYPPKRAPSSFPIRCWCAPGDCSVPSGPRWLGSHLCLVWALPYAPCPSALSVESGQTLNGFLTTNASALPLVAVLQYWDSLKSPPWVHSRRGHTGVTTTQVQVCSMQPHALNRDPLPGHVGGHGEGLRGVHRRELPFQ